MKRKRLLKYLATIGGLVFFAGYFAFSTFLFSPFEGGLGVDIAGVVPREVDFFVARADLGEVFDGFPRLAIQDELEQQEAWKVWTGSGECTELSARLRIDETLRDLEEIAGRIPLGFDPLTVFGGRDLVLAGNFNGPDIADADWAVYATVNWMGKLAIELLRYPGLIGIEAQGIAVQVEENYVVLRGAQLPRDLYVSRVKNVGLLTTSVQFVEKAHTMASKQFEDSMLLRAEYSDYIRTVERSNKRDELEAFLQMRRMLENLRLSGAWPDAKSQQFLPAFLGKFFQANTLNLMVGTIGTDQGLRVDLHGQLSSELMTPLQDRNFRRKGADRDEILRSAANLAPQDCSLFIYLRGNTGDLLEQVLASLDPALVGLLEDAMQATGRYRDLKQLVDELELALMDRMVLVLRPNDYPEDPDGPPHDDTPVPAVALITWIQEGKANIIEDLRDLIGQQGAKFGLAGRKAGESGYYRNYVGGYEIREYWSPFVPGTGVVATVNADERCIVANSFRMLDHILKTSTQGAPSHPRLSERFDFRELLVTSLPAANVVVWVNPESAAPTLRRQIRRWARDSIVIDWKLERARCEQQVINELFPGQGKVRGRLTEQEQERVDSRVDPMLAELEERIQREQVPAVMAQYERRITYAEAVRAALLMLSLDSKRMDLSLRVVVPLAPKR